MSMTKNCRHDNQKPYVLIELFYGEGNWMNWTSFTHVPKEDILIFPSC